MTAPKKIESYVYNELVSGACDDARETFLEEPLGYWYSGPGTGNDSFPPEPERRWANGWVDGFDGRKATHDEWDLYARTYRDAMRFIVKYVERHWDPDSEDEDHYEEVTEAVVSQLIDGDFKVPKPDPIRALVRACKLVLAIEANPEQNPTETVKLAPKTREQILAAVRAAG